MSQSKTPSAPWNTRGGLRGPRTKKNPGLLAEAPDNQAYLRVPSIPSVAWQPYPSPLGRLRAHSFASPPHDGFAFVEDGQKRRHSCRRGRSSHCLNRPHKNNRTHFPNVQMRHDFFFVSSVPSSPCVTFSTRPFSPRSVSGPRGGGARRSASHGGNEIPPWGSGRDRACVG